MPPAATAAVPKAPKAPKAAPKAAKGKAGPAPTSTAPPQAATPPPTTDATTAPAGSGKPDQKAHNEEQDALKAQIDKIQAQLNAVKAKIDGSGKGGPQNERRIQLRKELDELRSQQGGIKDNRGKILSQIKASQDVIQRKVDTIKAAKTKTPYKTVAEIDSGIKALDAKIATGISIAAEKQAVLDISKLRRTRRTFEAFQSDEDAIQAERTKIDELRKQLDDPAQKAISDKYDAIKRELDVIQKEGDEAYANRNKLFDERNALQDEVNVLWQKKKEGARLYREANDKYWAKVMEDRQKRDQRFKEQRAAEDAERLKEVAERLREEAQVPAYQAQIEECGVLINYFIRLSGGTVPDAAVLPSVAPAKVVGVPELTIRQVDADFEEGMVLKKKKGEDEAEYFVGKKAKKGGAKANGSGKVNGKMANGNTNGAPSPVESKPTESKLHLPYGTLTALLNFSIPPPTSTDDIPQTIENLNKKKDYYVAVQPKATQDNIDKVEAEIKRLEQGLHKGKKGVNGSATTSAVKMNGVGGTTGKEETASPTTSADAIADPPAVATSEVAIEEKAVEPTATPAVGDDLSSAVPAEPVMEKLEEAKEEAEAEEAA